MIYETYDLSSCRKPQRCSIKNFRTVFKTWVQYREPSVGPTHDPDVSRITIVADGDEHTVEQIEKQLNKLIEVIKVKTFEANEYLARELMIVKVSAVANRRSEIMTIADITGAKVMDITLTTMTLELCDTYAHLCRFEEVIAPYGIIEMVRTGTIAIEKGSYP